MKKIPKTAPKPMAVSRTKRQLPPRKFINRPLTILLSIHFTLMVVTTGIAQSMQQPAFPSPSAAAVGKTADMPVDYFSGVARTTIP